MATRCLALLAMVIAAGFQNPAGVGHLDPTVGDIFGLWDAQWYERIVDEGYPVPLPLDSETGRITYSAWAFYPLFPYAVKALMITGLPFAVTAGILNFLLGWVGAVLVWTILRQAVHAAPQAYRDRLALIAACLWCCYPATGILLVPYSEAIAVVLVTGALLLIMRRRYLWAGAALLTLGATRAIAPALGVVVLVHLFARWRDERAEGRALFVGDRWRILALILAVPISALAWPTTVGLLTGRPTAFFDVQAVWGQRPERGPFVLWLAWAWEERGAFGVLLIAGVVTAYLMLVAGRHGRCLPLEVRAWALAYPLYLLAVVRPITSMWRFLLLDFPIAALLASVAMRTSVGGRIVPHWRRRVGVLLVPLLLGMLWWTVSFLTYVPWDSSPP